MPSSLFDALSVVSSAARIATRSATIQTSHWAHQSRLPETLTTPQAQHGPSKDVTTRSGEQLHHAAPAPSAALPSTDSIVISLPRAPGSLPLASVTNDKNVTLHPAMRTVQSFILETGSGVSQTLPDSSSAPLEADQLLSTSPDACGSPRLPDLDHVAPASVLSRGRPEHLPFNQATQVNEPQVILKPSRVPSSRLARLFHYGGLAAGLGVGAASEFLRRSGGEENSGSLLLSEGNISRLVDKLSKMRGAALKLGQFLSIQDAHVLPPQLESVFQQLQNKANYMPNWQMEQVMCAELGTNWLSAFEQFDPIPVASASIGQVHRARLADSGTEVAIKIQFPNVAQSITSDLSNLSLLLTTSSLLPRGLFLQNTINAMQQELIDECDYEREAHYMRVFADNLQGNEAFRVPKVISKLTTKRVLVMEWMQGVPLTRAVHFDQSTKNEIASRVLELCLRELFDFSMMQTDPNWTNFLWNPGTQKIELIDFGATREYSKDFIDQWLRLLRAAISHDDEECLQASRAVGYLTGEENEQMVSAHLESMFLLASPFRQSSGETYRFSGQTITTQIKSLIPVMLRHRLTPPPRETYSLNRMLSGAFLLCARLDAEVPCSRIWHEATDHYEDAT
ncbi:ABC1-domain-containing protein [Calocera viscosa TUFC12733]|uniref:ABC1-domain-containing protein n=1 Tax=Calocera viscosa (strain TUFC12733) TaxID=1330018 RepID=A0A167N9S8_CALVF|nr:ABC1-domain-containing protein [Calocera viscosa TUFC12733]